MKKNINYKALLTSTLALGMCASLVPLNALEAFANDPAIVAFAMELGTPGGVANFGKGDAKITIKNNEGQSLVGKKFNVYKLFDAENSKAGESINYTWNETFKPALQAVVGPKLNPAKPANQVTEYEVIDYIQTMNRNNIEGVDANYVLEGRYSNYRFFVEELRNKIEEMGLQGDVVTVTEVKADGSFDIAGLTYGYYITDEIYTSGDKHAAASLCMVNTANPNAEVTIKSDFPSVIKKINEDDNNIAWNDIGDYEIGQTVPYKFVSDVANMNGYDTYYYAWHDQMDKALTFNKDSVGITITSPSMNKTYVLKANEFLTTVNPNDGHSFDIEIQNIKGIIDREFNQMNADKENIYDQEVVLTYNATLNDSAAENTGRPGFENDVQLEFSNDADFNGKGETGKTPWDTVVCFTYRLDGLKTNNHNAVLEDAHFRLYSDEDCNNEVFVKQMPDGTYHVINRDSVGGSDHTGGQAPAQAVEMISDKDGVFTIIGLDQGTYWLKETDSPDGYRELLDPIKITVTPTFTNDRNNYVKGDGATEKVLQKLEAQAHSKWFLSGIFGEKDEDLVTDIDKGNANITVINTVGKKLPITGSSATIIMLGAGTMMMLVALKKKKDNDEELKSNQ